MRVSRLWFITAVWFVRGIAVAYFPHDPEAVRGQVYPQPEYAEGQGDDFLLPSALSVVARSNLVVNFNALPNGAMQLEFLWQESFTDTLEIFGTFNLTQPEWQLIYTNIMTTNSGGFVWIDYAATNTPGYYYCIGSVDLDSDQDGLPDARELLLYHSNPQQVDTDGDGLKDGTEVLVYETSPILADSDGDRTEDLIEILQGRDTHNGAVYDGGQTVLLMIYHVSGG